jgi:hypothetical protein
MIAKTSSAIRYGAVKSAEAWDPMPGAHEFLILKNAEAVKRPRRRARGLCWSYELKDFPS